MSWSECWLSVLLFRVPARLSLRVRRLEELSVSFIMLRRDSSSLNPRDIVRFLGEPLLSSVTECIVLYVLDEVYVRNTSELSVGEEVFCCFLRSSSSE